MQLKNRHKNAATERGSVINTTSVDVMLPAQRKKPPLSKFGQQKDNHTKQIENIGDKHFTNKYLKTVTKSQQNHTALSTSKVSK
jgi:hypothetical protein